MRISNLTSKLNTIGNLTHRTIKPFNKGLKSINSGDKDSINKIYRPLEQQDNYSPQIETNPATTKRNYITGLV